MNSVLLNNPLSDSAPLKFTVSLQDGLTYWTTLLAESNDNRYSLLCCIRHVQWNLSIVDTIGTDQCVLIKEVSLFQRYLCTLEMLGTLESVLIIEVPTVRVVIIVSA